MRYLIILTSIIAALFIACEKDEPTLHGSGEGGEPGAIVIDSIIYSGIGYEINKDSNTYERTLDSLRITSQNIYYTRRLDSGLLSDHGPLLVRDTLIPINDSYYFSILSNFDLNEFFNYNRPE